MRTKEDKLKDAGTLTRWKVRKIQKELIALEKALAKDGIKNGDIAGVVKSIYKMGLCENLTIELKGKQNERKYD